MVGRAQPEVALDLEEKTGTKFPGPESVKVVAQITRIPQWLRDMVKDAALTEGLSVNAWVARVLAEHAKLSLHGWRSIPVTDPPRQHDDSSPSPFELDPDSDPYPPYRYGNFPIPQRQTGKTKALAEQAVQEQHYANLFPDEDIPTL